MSEKRRPRRKQLDTSHQRNWLTGRHAVSEVLTAGVWPFTRLCATAEAWNSLPAILPHHAEASAGDSSVEQVTAERLTELCGSRHHQGIAAQMGPFPYRNVAELRKLLSEKQSSPQLTPLVVVCDRIQDGHNLGAILRSCAAMAVDAVIIGESEQVGITPQVARASAGSANYIPVVRVEQLSAALAELSDFGFQILAASEKASTAVWDVDATTPTAVVIGSEAHGVADALLSACSQQITIPMLGRIGSLNAAVAAGMLLYELRRGRVVD